MGRPTSITPRFVVEGCDVVKVTERRRCPGAWLSLRHDPGTRMRSALLSSLPTLWLQGLQVV